MEKSHSTNSSIHEREQLQMEHPTFLMLDKTLPRYLRIVYPDRRKLLLQEDLEVAKTKAEEMGWYLQKLEWLPSFIAFPGEMTLSTLSDKLGISYKEQGLFPMDVSSALAVMALNVPESEAVKVLDLCCSPGAKLLMISEKVTADSVLVGVDISERRLQTCRALLEQWQMTFAEEQEIPQQYLFNCDGTRFGPDQIGSLLFASDILKKENEILKSRKRKNKSLRKRLSDGLHNIECQILQKQKILLEKVTDEASLEEKETIQAPILSQFDFILVDAECTHDASYRHMKYVEDGKKWVKKPSSDSSGVIGSSVKRRAQNRSEGYFVVAEEDDEEEDFWNNECTAEDVARFIETGKNHVEDLNQTSPAKVDDDVAVCPVETEDTRRSITLSHNIRDVKTSSEGKTSLLQLQRSLLENGFRLLKPGGVLVYSTCSEEEEQNEDVVRWLLRNYSDAVIDPLQTIFDHSFAEFQENKSTIDIPTSIEFVNRKKVTLMEGSISGTVRVNYTVGMSGHFIARIKRAVV